LPSTSSTPAARSSPPLRNNPEDSEDDDDTFVEDPEQQPLVTPDAPPRDPLPDQTTRLARKDVSKSAAMDRLETDRDRDRDAELDADLDAALDDTRGRGTDPLMGGEPRSHQASFHSRRSRLRSRSPDAHAASTVRTKYTIAGVFLVLCLVAFVVQTELSAYVQKDLGWNKAYCMLYLTHGSWTLLWPVQLLILRLQQMSVPWPAFWRHHVALLRSTAVMVQTQDLDWTRPAVGDAAGGRSSALRYLVRVTVFITSALTVAGLSWYVAVDLTTPSDLTAIYNCSAFFAYVFSVPLLREPLRLDKSIAVMVAIVGVLVVAYGDQKPGGADGQEQDAAAVAAAERAGERFLGNMVIGVGSVLYGLYEVLYKRYACPPEGCSPMRGVVFANTFGSLIGIFTLTVLWVPLPLLHWLGIETFELPTGHTAWMLFLSVIANATFAGSFLVLISLTSPVLSSVASLLTIFIVALTDWFITGEPLSAAALMGGLMIMIAFGMLSWSTWREMKEHEAAKAVDLTDSGDDSDRDPRED
jgi:drug/metabolite transporter (DMT)-like permease